jgi:rubredoxin
MRKFKCSICGYVYDESKGIPEKNIPPGTKWEDIPEDFDCPLCGAPKLAFEEIEQKSTIAVVDELQPDYVEALGELSSGELSALFSNLAKGCEKQQLKEEMNLFQQLADYYNSRRIAAKAESLDDIAGMLKTDLSESFPAASLTASAKLDRGALRALVWSEKVSRMLSSLLNRYAKAGDAMLENTNIYVCDICGFIYLGDSLPEVCPVCKVPNFKISQVGRR